MINMSPNWQYQSFSNVLLEPTRNGIYKNPSFQGKGIPIIKMGEVYENREIKDKKRDLLLLSDAEMQKLLVKEGDLLFCRTSLVASGVGHCAIVRKLTESTTFASNLILARINQKIANPNYYRYYFSSVKGINQLLSIARGTSVTTITGPDISSLIVAVPPLQIQNKIANILGSLDEKIELNRHMNKTLESIAQAIFKEWFVENPEAKGWKVKTIGDVVTVVGGSTPSTNNPIYWEEGTIYWATPKDLASLQSPILFDTNSRITELGLQQISSGLLLIGTVLLSSRAPIGYLAITQVPVAINQGFIAILCNEQIPNYYILHWLKKNIEGIKNRANGTTFLEINKSNFRSMSVVVPPPERMKTFIALVEPIYLKIVANLKETHTLVTLRDTLLPKFMSGHVELKVN